MIPAPQSLIIKIGLAAIQNTQRNAVAYALNLRFESRVVLDGSQTKNYADAEKNYKIALAKKILLERERGTPVTIISDVCRGNPEIAQLRFARDVAEVTYKAALEAINVYKIEVNILREQADREWNRGN